MNKYSNIYILLAQIKYLNRFSIIIALTLGSKLIRLILPSTLIFVNFIHHITIKIIIIVYFITIVDGKIILRIF